jgi:glycosyltransferase involved in cell wall biosynthesis
MRRERIRVLLVYHSAALSGARKIFEALAAHKEIELRVLGPRRAFNRKRNLLLEIPEPYHGKFDLVTGSVYKAMRNPTGPYLTGLLREMVQFRPQIIHIMDEVSSRTYLQALIYRNFFLRGAKVLFFGFENILDAPRSPRSRRKWDFICRNANGGGYANTEGLEKVVELRYPRDNLMVTYWGVPLNQFYPSRNEKLRRELGVHDKFVLGYVGRIVQEKGLFTLLNALKYLPESVHCLLIGDGPNRDFLIAKAKALDLEARVHWLGRIPRDQAHKYINTFDAFVLPSETMPRWKEQFGRVLPEAMACGVSIIGSDSGAIPEVIGKAGKIFPERDCYALATAIRTLYENPQLCRDLGKKGMKRAKEHFSCEAFAQKLVRLYIHTLAPNLLPAGDNRCS